MRGATSDVDARTIRGGPRRWVVALAGLALVASACGDGGQTEATGSTASSTTPGERSEEWCEELETIQQSPDVPEVDVGGAPDEIRAALERLLRSAESDLEDIAPDELASLIGAQVAVDAWDHEHCGGAHPFCTAWITVSGIIAASALSGSDAEPELEDLLEGVSDVLRDHAPDELLADVDTFLTYDPTTGDAEERRAEAAEDALDRWTWSERCPGASPPLESE